MRAVFRNTFARWAAAVSLWLTSHATLVRAEQPITFVLPAANFQPVAADAYATELPPPTPPQPEPLLTPPVTQPTAPVTAPTMLAPDADDAEPYMPTEGFEPLACPACNGGCNDGCYPLPMPNGQIPDDWMWGCGGWPYANGPGMCDDWKVGCRWHVQADGHLPLDARTPISTPCLTPRTPPATAARKARRRSSTSSTMPPAAACSSPARFPHRAGYQIQAGWEGIPEWNASIVYPKFSPYPMGPVDSSEQRSVFYTSNLQLGGAELHAAHVGRAGIPSAASAT